MRTLFSSVLALAVAASLPIDAHAGKLSKAERKVFIAEVEAAYPATVWALKDLPATSGLTMGIPWIGPVAEVTPAGYKIEAMAGMQAISGSMSSIWFGVAPNDTLVLKEVEYDDDFWVITFMGSGDSERRDTKIKVLETSVFSQVQPVLAELIATADPLDGYPDWSADVKNAIRKGMLINGMNERQAFMVVGEPTGSSVREEDGVKIETWNLPPNDGMRIGYASSMEMTGWPTELRFEDGLLVGIATTSSGGVSLD